MTTRRSTGVAVGAMLLLLVAALCFGLSSAYAGIQRHAYDSGPPPSTVTLTARHVYHLSVRGGRTAVAARGANANEAECSWSSGGIVQPLTVTVLPADAGAVSEVATFVAPAGGRAQIHCANWGSVFVDDADGSTFDRSGLFLLLGVVTLTTGVALGLGLLYRSRTDVEHGVDAP